MMLLKPNFFAVDTLKVAHDLIGKFLVRKDAFGKTHAHMITEVEAYVGPHDLACHAAKGKTPRTETMFGPPGRWYVYLIYGMYWMLNIVTEEEGYPAAVLIRSINGASGPGRLTKFLKIDRSFNGKPADHVSGLWIEDRVFALSPGIIKRTPRIGVSYAGPMWAAKPYRFLVESAS